MLPTGAGKSVIASSITYDAVQLGKHVVFLVNRQAIVDGMSEHWQNAGIEHGVIMGDQSRRAWLPVQAASIDTLRRRAALPRADLVFVDEAHFALTESWQDVQSRLLAAGARIILMTASPEGPNGMGLKAIADEIIIGPTTAELTELGHLVRVRLFVPERVEAPTHSGEFTEAEQSVILDTPKIVGDTVETWGKLGRDMPSIGFFVNKRHAENTAARFRAAGVRAISVTSDDSRATRRKAWKDLPTGQLQYACTVGLVSYGWDVPETSYASLVIMTKSLPKYLQAGGRIMRPAQNKPFAIMADHGGNYLRHGFLDDVRHWTLNGRSKKKPGESEDLPPEEIVRVCPKCKEASRHTAVKCPCGYVFAVSLRTLHDIKHEEGELKEIVHKPEEYDRYADGVGNDPALAAIVDTARKLNHKPGSVWYKKKLLDDSRAAYRSYFQREPETRWTGAAMRSMIDVARTRHGMSG